MRATDDIIHRTKSQALNELAELEELEPILMRLRRVHPEMATAETFALLRKVLCEMAERTDRVLRALVELSDALLRERAADARR